MNMTATVADRFRIIREDLHRRFGASVSAREIDRVIDEVIDEHSAPAAVEDFVPLLVEREARSRLLKMGTKRPEVLFASRNNSARAQLAYAYLRHLAGDDVYARTVGIGGQEPVDPLVVQVLEERGIPSDMLYVRDDIARTAHRADVIVLLGIDDVPGLPGKRYERWSVTHPRTIDEARVVADQIEGEVRRLLAELEA